MSRPLWAEQIGNTRLRLRPLMLRKCYGQSKISKPHPQEDAVNPKSAI